MTSLCLLYSVVIYQLALFSQIILGATPPPTRQPGEFSFSFTSLCGVLRAFSTEPISFGYQRWVKHNGICKVVIIIISLEEKRRKHHQNH